MAHNQTPLYSATTTVHLSGGRPDLSSPVSFRSMSTNGERAIVNRVLQTANALFCRIYHDLTVLSPSTVPASGPAVLVCNHISGLDPIMIQSACPRMIVWMMAREYYDLPIVKHVYKAIEAIPVERSGRDTAATRAALRALRSGRVLGVFPEGRIESSRELLPFQGGVALMAAKAEAPIVPAYLDGTSRDLPMIPAITRSQRVSIAFGEPMRLPAGDTRSALTEGTAAVQAAVERLRVRVQSARSNGRWRSGS